MAERRAAQGVGLAGGVGHAEREIGVAAGDELEVERRLGGRVVLAQPRRDRLGIDTGNRGNCGSDHRTQP
jgi:hypothetical protein